MAKQASRTRRKPTRTSLNGNGHAAKNRLWFRPLRAYYDAVQRTEDDLSVWKQADALSAKDANSLAVRRDLRQRARYEYANNSYINGMVRTLAVEVVGVGPVLQVIHEDRTVATAIEERFAQWARRASLASKLALCRIEQAVSGEAFCVFQSRDWRPVPVLDGPGPIPPLDLRVIECDLFSDPGMSEPNTCDGIELDDNDEPVRYTILRDHPTKWGAFDRNPQKVQADRVCHLFSRSRAGQCRGVPDMTPVLRFAYMRRRFALAVLAAAETAASFAAIVETLGDAAHDMTFDELQQQMAQVELKARTLGVAPFGTKVTQLRAEQPQTTYPQYDNHLLRGDARAFGMPFNMAVGDSSGGNFASGRLDHLAFDNLLTVERMALESVILTPCFVQWFELAKLIPGALPPEALANDFWVEVRWGWKNREHVDQLKRANADSVDLRSGVKSFADVLGGKDWEQHFAQLKRERERAAEIPGLLQALGVQQEQASTEDSEDDE